jgi:hypothetical protein
VDTRQVEQARYLVLMAAFRSSGVDSSGFPTRARVISVVKVPFYLLSLFTYVHCSSCRDGVRPRFYGTAADNGHIVDS